MSRLIVITLCYLFAALLIRYSIEPVPFLKIVFAPSPSSDDRLSDTIIDTIVLHATERETLGEVISVFSDPRFKVSAHFTIDRDGKIVKHVDELKRAWHAGTSKCLME